VFLSFVTLTYLEGGTLARKTRDSYSSKNSMLTILPDIYGDVHYEFAGDVHYEFAPQGQAVHQQHYFDMLQCLQ
jgi:hypothetical protein